MLNRNFFVTTRSDSAFYDLINSALKLNAEKKLKKKLEIFYVKKSIPSLKFLLFFVFNIINLNFFFDNKYIKLNFQNCSIGRHSFSYAMRQKNSYISFIFKTFYKAKGLFLGGSIIETAYSISNISDAGYFDHGVYLNGLYIEVFAKKKKIVYTNNFPRGLVCGDYRLKGLKFKKHEDILTIFRSNKHSKLKIKNKSELIKRKIINPKSLDYLKPVKFKKINDNFNYDKYKYIVYPQGFSDAQLLFGYSGFPTIKDWFIYLLDFFVTNNIHAIIKPHPNFFDINQIKQKKIIKAAKDLAFLDYSTFNSIKKKYQKFENLLFLEDPLPNHLFLKKLNNRKHVLLLHHTTAILEGCFFGFKCITSKPFWTSQFKISNVFDSKTNLKNLLNSDFKNLEYAKKEDLNDVLYQFYLNPYGIFGKKHFQIPIKNNLGFNKLYKFGYSKQIRSLVKKHSKKKLKTIKEISNCVQNL